jgi:spore cortex formation protein SpoVR/YcgB (stage V sporulation)
MSPAANPVYIEKFKIKIDRVTVVGHSDVFKNESLSRNWTIDRAVISNLSLSEKEWFTGIFLFYVYVALSSKLNLHGRETRIIDNHHRIQSTIDKSFQYFLKTRRIAIEDSVAEKSIYHYVENNVDDLRFFFHLNDIS